MEEEIKNLVGNMEIMKKDEEEWCVEFKEDWEITHSKLSVKGMIARGTGSSVHRGLYDGQEVAVKLLHSAEGNKGTFDSFMQEVSAWHKLDHPNITKFIGAMKSTSALNFDNPNTKVSIPSNTCCVVVEYLPRGTLKKYLIKNYRSKLPFKVVIQLGLDLARGLSYLHSKKIVHRDLKTENLLLDKTGALKITDFGVARIEAANAKDMTAQTGTLGYMAPEVLSGDPYDRKCDVYSFGICLWEIYCCDMPYANLSFAELSTAVVYKDRRPEIPKCCPKSLANIMRRCWDADPRKRPEMEEVVTMLEAIDSSKRKGMIPLDQPQGCFCFSRFTRS